MVSVFGNLATTSSFSSLNKTNKNIDASLNRIASGLAIAQASDNVANLAVGTGLLSQVSTERQALANVNQGSSLLQVANGGVTQTLDILERQKVLATQSANGSLDNASRSALNQEFQQLSNQLNQIAGSTSFNGVTLLNGGTGTTTSLSNTDALSASFTTAATGSNSSSAANSTKAIEAFSSVTGASLNTTAQAGGITITDSGGAALTNGAFASVSGALSGSIDNISLSNVNYGSSATVTASINGVNFTGTYTNGATSVQLSNGSTFINLGTGTSAGASTALNISDAGNVAASQAGLNNVFANTSIQRVQVVNGVDFSGTSLGGTTGGVSGIATARLDSANATISNFQYTGNTGAANSNTLSVDINGQTFTATGVKDTLSNGDTLVFQSADKQILKIDLTGLSAPTGNIRTDATAQTSFTSALNEGFAKAGSGLNFAAGTGSTSGLNVSLGSTTTASLFNGQALDISTAAGAQNSLAAIDNAIQQASSIQASIGAQQSSFNATAANLESAIQSQSAASDALLGTDIASESSSLASSLVQQQATIATQAQAKKLSQSLLKLI